MLKAFTSVPISYYNRTQPKDTAIRLNVPYEEYLLIGLLAQHAMSYERMIVSKIVAESQEAEVPIGDPILSCSSHMLNMVDFCSHKKNFKLNIRMDTANAIFTVELIPLVEIDSIDLQMLGFKKDKILSYSMVHVDRANHLFMLGVFLISSAFAEYKGSYTWLIPMVKMTSGVEDSMMLGDEAYIRETIVHMTNSVESYKLEDKTINLKMKSQEFFGPEIDDIKPLTPKSKVAN